MGRTMARGRDTARWHPPSKANQRDHWLSVGVQDSKARGTRTGRAAQRRQLHHIPSPSHCNFSGVRQKVAEGCSHANETINRDCRPLEDHEAPDSRVGRPVPERHQFAASSGHDRPEAFRLVSEINPQSDRYCQDDVDPGASVGIHPARRSLRNCAAGSWDW